MPSLLKGSAAVFCLLAALFCAAPYAAHAESYTPNFSLSPCPIGFVGPLGCTNGLIPPITLVEPPTAPDVTFPSPFLAVTFVTIYDGGAGPFPFPFDITLSALDLPGDSYTWEVTSDCKIITVVPYPEPGCFADMQISDATTGVQSGASIELGTTPLIGGSGDLTFKLVTATPEPSSLALVLFGMTIVPLMRRRKGQSLPQTS
jgi:hypothetical protein